MTSPGVLEGAPVVYGRATRVRTRAGVFDEAIAPGALDGLLIPGVALVRDHDPALLLGIVGVNVEVEDGPKEISLTAPLAGDELGYDTAARIRAGLLLGMSFRGTFGVVDASWHEQGCGVPLRVIHQMRTLAHFAVVGDPAFLTAGVTVRTSAAVQRAAGTFGRPGGRVIKPSALGRRCRPPAWSLHAQLERSAA